MEQGKTYVQWLLQHDPAGLGLDLKVLQVVRAVGGAQGVHDGAVVVGVLVRGGHAQDVGADAGVLLDVFDVFLKEN